MTGIALPKLPKQDIDAVRGTLAGKLLGRTAALLSLVLILMLYAGAVDRLLESWLQLNLDTLPVAKAALMGLPMAAVAAQLLLEYRDRRLRNATKDLAVNPAKVPGGYFRIGPYRDTPEDRKQFGRADGAHLAALDRIRASQALPLYLTGDSGCGKSSLLSAFVLPKLREEGWTIIEARAYQDPEAALRDALLAQPDARRPRAGASGGLPELATAAAKRAGGKLLLVIDQFEEFVILGQPDRHAAFAATLATLAAAPEPRARLLLVVRSDYEPQVEQCGFPPFRQGETYLRIGRFAIPHADAFLAGSGLGLTEAQRRTLLASAAELDDTPGLVRPITLNVVGHVLASGPRVAAALDAGTLVRGYVAQAIGQPALRDRAPGVLDCMVTEQGTKKPVTEAELMRATRLNKGEVRAVLNGLAEKALARPLDAAEATWELSHDFVARSVARFLGRERRMAARRAVAFSAPALLVLAVAAGAGEIAWQSLSPHRLRSELAQLGLTVTDTDDGVAVERNSHFSPENWARAGTLLLRLQSIAPVRSLNLWNTLVADVSPLKGLTDLTSINLWDTRVEDVSALKELTALTSLNLWYTKVTDLAPLQDLPKLHLRVRLGSKVSDAEIARFRTYRVAHGLAPALAGE